MSLNPGDQRYRGRDLAGGVAQHSCQPLRLRHRRFDLVQPEVVGDLLGVVDDVVERGGQVQYVLAVDWRDERLVEPADQVVGDVIAVVLAGQDLAREVLALGISGQHLVEQLGRSHDVRAGTLEQVEELAVVASQEVRDGRHRYLLAHGSDRCGCARITNLLIAT